MKLEQFSEEETNQIVAYGIERGKVILITTFITIMIGYIFGIFYQGVIFWCCLSILRRYAGGYHADTQNRCYAISFSVIILSLLSIKQIGHIGIKGLVFQMISLFIIVLLAPVENQNRVLDESEKKKYGFKTKFVAVTLSFIYVVLYIVNKQRIAIPIGVASGVVVISLITGYIKGVRQKK
jgi:Membrane protein putatively involved in post-translational modification of the autoinducing quorum-sensing peptide